MKSMRVLLFVVLMVVATLPPLAAATTARVEKYPFTLTGQLVSVKGATLLIKVAKASSALMRFEQKGELTVILAPKAVVKMGKTRVSTASLKPQERVSVVGWYTLGAKPVIEATSVTVLGSR